MDKTTKLFFEHHKIDLNNVLDAKGKSVYSLKDYMKENNYYFAYNTTPCSNHGHTIKDIYSHCIVCKPANIAFLKRSKVSGVIYIAGSLKKQYIKIGMTTEEVKTRISKLNSRGVGNTNDWQVIKSFKCDNTNKIENLIIQNLSNYKVENSFYGDTESSEIFRCKFSKAYEESIKVFEINKIKFEEKSYINNINDFNRFMNLSKKI